MTPCCASGRCHPAPSSPSGGSVAAWALIPGPSRAMAPPSSWQPTARSTSSMPHSSTRSRGAPSRPASSGRSWRSRPTAGSCWPRSRTRDCSPSISQRPRCAAVASSAARGTNRPDCGTWSPVGRCVRSPCRTQGRSSPSSGRAIRASCSSRRPRPSGKSTRRPASRRRTRTSRAR